MNCDMTTVSNVNIEETYGPADENSIVHYETFDNLAKFYGRISPVHFHDRFYQIHYLTVGEIFLQLDGQEHYLKAPCFIFTPPSIPHGFYSDEHTHGYVLTIPQEFIWQLLTSLKRDINYFYPFCVELSPEYQEDDESICLFENFFTILAKEYAKVSAEKPSAMRLYAKIILLEVYRLSKTHQIQYVPSSHELRLFNQFNLLVEDNYKNNWKIKDYLDKLCISESRLNSLCQRFSSVSPKRLVIERLLQEAKRKLRFTQDSVHEIAYQRGFKDPAYFSRFFQKETSFSPKQFRDQDHI